MRAMIFGFVVALALAGCASVPRPDEGIFTQQASPVESTMPPADEEAEPNGAGCNLSAPEGATVQIVDVGDALMVTWEDSPVAPASTTGYYVTVYDASGNVGQLGIEYLDGRQSAYFIADLGAGQVNLDGQADRDPRRKSLTARFPKDIGFLAFGDVVKWKAAYTRDGSDVGTCPEPPDSALSFPTSGSGE